MDAIRNYEVLYYVGLGGRYRNVETYSTGMAVHKLAQALVHDPSCSSSTSRPTAWIERARRDAQLVRDLGTKGSA